ncbi:MAG: M48 family metallopeptidase [Hydrogenophilales bacterium]|nr:M48 family metallopeptidase [Hydrogenophilales bacterium]
MQTFTLIFLAALALATALQLWLARRHIAYILTHKTQVPAAFSDKIGLEAHQKAADYTVAKTRLSFIHIALDAAVLLAFTLGGGIEWLTQAWQGVFDSPLLEGAALLLSTLILMSALEIPLSLYREFGLEARFGFNKMTLGLFVLDLIKQAALGLALGVPLVLGVLWLMGAMGEYWWLYVWLAWVGFNLLIIAVYPAFIAPLFNKFTPLEDTALKSRIETLLQKCGFHASGLFVMDGSKRSAHGNAYFSGFGKTKRIVFFDTLLNNLSGDEIEAVLAHELGHFKRRHIVKRMAWLFSASLIGVWVLAYLMQASWFYACLGVATQTPATALLLFVLVSPVFTFLLHPLSARLSRKHEFEADQYAAQTSSATALVHALVKMYEDNASTLTPDPLHSAFYDSHPPAGIRIARLQAAS